MYGQTIKLTFLSAHIEDIISLSLYPLHKDETPSGDITSITHSFIRRLETQWRKHVRNKEPVWISI